MSVTPYTYSKSAFVSLAAGDGVSIDGLEEAIQSELGILIGVRDITDTGGDIVVVMKGALSSGEEALLDAIVAAHAGSLDTFTQAAVAQGNTVSVVLTDDDNRTVIGEHAYDASLGGKLVPPSGVSLPLTTRSGEMFWKTDEQCLYRRDDTNTSWVAIVAPVQPHESSHRSGGTDELAHANLAGKGSNTHAQIDVHVASTANPHSVTAAQVGAATETQHDSHVANVSNPHSVTAAQAGAVPSSEKGAAGGVASLDGGGKVPAAQLPSGTGASFSVVADSTARLALSTSEGDEAYQQDDDSQWIYDGSAWFERPSSSGSGLAVDRHASRDDGQDSNSTTTWQEKLTLTADVVGGTYRIEWYAEVRSSSNNKEMNIRIQINDADLAVGEYEPRSVEWTPWSGWDEIFLSAESHNIDIDFKRVDSSNVAYVRQARISIRKVAD